VIGQDAAARVFVDAVPPATVGTIVGGVGGGGSLKYLWLLLLLPAIILIVWFLMRKNP
jgi:hypothetical protein